MPTSAEAHGCSLHDAHLMSDPEWSVCFYSNPSHPELILYAVARLDNRNFKYMDLEPSPGKTIRLEVNTPPLPIPIEDARAAWLALRCGGFTPSKIPRLEQLASPWLLLVHSR